MMERRRRITLGGAMVFVAVLTLVMALIVQTRRAAEQEARLQAEIDRLRTTYELNGEPIIHPWTTRSLNMTDNATEKAAQ